MPTENKYDPVDFFGAERHEEKSKSFDISVEVGEWCKENCPYFDMDEQVMYADGLRFMTIRFCKNLPICRNAIRCFKEL